MRRLICLMLLVCLPLHSFAMQGGSLLFGVSTDSAISIAHELEHDEGTQHHHEDNGLVHYDDSDESVKHVQDHSSSPQPAYVAVPYPLTPPEQLALAVSDWVTRIIPAPFLDSPLRPPALTLGHAAGGPLHS